MARLPATVAEVRCGARGCNALVAVVRNLGGTMVVEHGHRQRDEDGERRGGMFFPVPVGPPFDPELRDLPALGGDTASCPHHGPLAVPTGLFADLAHRGGRRGRPVTVNVHPVRHEDDAGR